tara:strand:- start:3848 stop:6112 length:2265 start_codon:yes stop_codon:yes gene_type:complete
MKNEVTQKFVQALMDKNHSEIQKCLNSGADFETLMPIRLADPYQKGLSIKLSVTPLKYAAANGDLKSVNLIHQYLKKKYSPSWGIKATWNFFFGSQNDKRAAHQRNICGIKDFSFLHAAVQGGNLDVVKKAISEFKVNPNESPIILKNTTVRPTESYSLTPLTLATILGHKDIITYLVEIGAKHALTFYTPNKYIDTRALTPLSYAASQDDLSMVKFLLAHNANIDETDHMCWTALMQAARANAEKTVDYLLQTANLKKTDMLQALLWATNSGHQKIVTLLLKSGTNPFQVDTNDKLSAIACAANNKDLKMLKTLISDYKSNIKYSEPFPTQEELEKGKKIESYDNAKDFYYRHGDKLRFYRALQLNNINEMKVILDNFDRKVYFDIDDTFENGNTSLHIACQEQKLKSVRYLISKGADINAVNDNGETTLMLAIQNGPDSELIVKSLLNHGANINCQDMQNKTELMHAAEKGQESIFDHLIEHPENTVNLGATDKKGNTLFLLAAASGSKHCTTKLLELGANPTDKNNNGDNALSTVAHNTKDIVMPKALIAKGVAIDSRNKDNKTAFQIALEKENLSLCTTLIAARTLFLIANKQINIEDNSELDFLFSHGAHAGQRDSLNRSLLQVAVLNQNTTLSEYLVEMDEFIDDEQNLNAQQKKQNYKYDFQGIHNGAEDLLHLAKTQQEKSLINNMMRIANIDSSNIASLPEVKQVTPPVTHSYDATTKARREATTTPKQAPINKKKSTTKKKAGL